MLIAGCRGHFLGSWRIGSERGGGPGRGRWQEARLTASGSEGGQAGQKHGSFKSFVAAGGNPLTANAGPDLLVTVELLRVWWRRW